MNVISKALTLVILIQPIGIGSYASDSNNYEDQQARINQSNQIASIPSPNGIETASISSNSHSFTWTEATPNCATVYKDGDAYRVINADEIIISCCPANYGKYQIFKVMVFNQSHHSIDVLPEKFILGANNAADLNSSAKSKASTAHTLAWITHGNYVPGEGYCAPARSASRLSGSVLGNSFYGGSNTTYYRRPSLIGLVASHAAKQADGIRVISEQLLKANTLLPGQQTFGYVPFPKAKSTEPQELKVIIGQDTFVFGGY
jgi:hypothetical protein